jgi:hypothetical protein
MRKLFRIAAFVVASTAMFGSFTTRALADPIRCPSELTPSRLANFHSICYDSCKAEKKEKQAGCRASCDRTDQYCANLAKEAGKKKH